MSSTNSSFVGLKNQGATCYLNSLIQTLFLTPEFRQELFSLTPNEVGLNEHEHEHEEQKENRHKQKRKKIIVELQKLFARLQCPDFAGAYCSEFALSTKSLTNSFGWNAAQAQDQHDINELYNLLLDGIEKQMPSNKKILNKYYKGKIINIIQCELCNNESKRYEEFVQLNVILQTSNESFDTLHESLLSSFIDNNEELKDENAYFCTNCAKKVSAKKYCRLIKLPSIMVCNLNRFYFDLSSGERVKINKKFLFPKSFDLSMFVDNEYNEMDANEMTDYDLIGIVVHRGSGANAGHYHAYIRDMNDEVNWKPVARNKKKKNKRRRRSRRGAANSDKDLRKKEKKEEVIAALVSILMDNEQLARNELMKRFNRMTANVGWDYGYKTHLNCTFTAFLRNNHRFRIIDPDARNFSVCLAKDFENNKNRNRKNDEESDESDDVEIMQEAPKKRGRGRPPKKKNTPNKNKNKKRKKNKKNKNDLDGFIVHDNEDQDEEYEAGSLSPASLTSASRSPQSPTYAVDSDDNKQEYDVNGPHWFDFNDEDITAVLGSEIDDLYDGGDEECPYMVIYRRKCMNTGNWPPEIPPFVSSLLIDEPLDAEEDKQEISIGIVKLTLGTKLVRKTNRFLSDSDCDSESESNVNIETRENEVSIAALSSDDDIDIVMNDFKINTPPKSFMRNSDSNGSLSVAIATNVRPEIVIISSDDDESPQNLICVTPKSVSPKHKPNTNKENISNNSRHSNSKKRKFLLISNENNNQKFGEEPQKKKRKLQQGVLANLPDPNKKSVSSTPEPKRLLRGNKNKKKKKNNKNTNNKSEMVKKEYVKSEYLEPIPMTKGNNIRELYIAVSEWSGIAVNNLQIATITGRRKQTINNLKDKDESTKLKRVPIDNCDNILVWNGEDGHLAEKELLRRKQCISLSIYILNRQYPQSIYINHKTQTFSDLYQDIYALLNESERKTIIENGRFRDVDTRDIYRYDNNASLKAAGIDTSCILRFESECVPKANEIVIRYRLKTSDIKPKDSSEEELYIEQENDISTLKILMCSKFNIDPTKFNVRKGQKNWSLGKEIEDNENVKISELKFHKTQRLILAESNINKNERKVSFYCQTQQINGIKSFKIPSNCLRKARESNNKNQNASFFDNGMDAINLLKRPIGNRANNFNNKQEDDSDVDGDVLMDEKKEKEVVPMDDGLDIYDCNSDILCTVKVDKNDTGLHIKRAIINCDCFNLNTKLKKKLSPLHLRVSIRGKYAGRQPTWQILGANEKKIGLKNGKCIVEFFDTPKKDNKFGQQASGMALLFVHKKVTTQSHNAAAIYGSRYEIEVTDTQRQKLEPLKTKIISQCDFPKNTDTNDIMLASRNLLSHKWTILEEREHKPKKNQREAAKKNAKKVFKIWPKPFDRAIIAVLYIKDMNENVVKEINGEYFETEWDKYYSVKYEEKAKEELDHGDEPLIIINFSNDSDDNNKNNSNNNDDDDNDK